MVDNLCVDMLSVRPVIHTLKCVLISKATSTLFSSPEHEVWSVVARRRPSCVVRRASSVNIWYLLSRGHICDTNCMTFGHSSLLWQYLGPVKKTRSPGQILGNSCLQSRGHIGFWWNLVRMFVWTITRPGLNMGYVGTKTRSPGQILETYCLHYRGQICYPILTKLGVYVCFDNI